MATDGMHLAGSSQVGHHAYNAQASGPDTAEAHVGDLNGEMFPQHPRTGIYFSLKGDECAPWELAVLESHSTGDTRHQTVTKSPEWENTIVVSTPVTRGEGTERNSGSLDLPNHAD